MKQVVLEAWAESKYPPDLWTDDLRTSDVHTVTCSPSSHHICNGPQGVLNVFDIGNLCSMVYAGLLLYKLAATNLVRMVMKFTKHY